MNQSISNNKSKNHKGTNLKTISSLKLFNKLIYPKLTNNPRHKISIPEEENEGEGKEDEDEE